MDEKRAFYFRVNKNYWQKVGDRLHENPQFVRLTGPPSQLFARASIIAGENLVNIVGEEAFQTEIGISLRGEMFYVMWDEEMLAWSVCDRATLAGGQNSDVGVALFEAISREQVESFRRRRKEQLLNCLVDPDSDLHQKTAALSKYLGCEQFSIWIRCDESRYLVLREASFQTTRKAIPDDDPQSILSSAFQNPSHFQECSVDHKIVTTEALRLMQSAVRIRVPLVADHERSNSVALFSFYSRNPDYQLQEAQKLFVERCTRMVISNEIVLFAGQFANMATALLDGYKPNSLRTFLASACQMISDRGHFEAVSIFRVDNFETPTKLHLAAVKEREFREAHAVYDLDGAGLTPKVFKSNRAIVSYAINEDSENSHIFDELTDSPAENWIGIPIARQDDDLPVGVLRATNHFTIERTDGKSFKRLVPLNDYDIRLLKHCARVIAYVETSEHFTAERRAAQAKDNEELKHFISTYRHELNSPMHMVVNIRSRLRGALHRDKIFERTMPLSKYTEDFCKDTEAIASRMDFIVNALRLEPELLVRQCRYCHCFQSIAAPIMRFAQIAARSKKRRLEFDIDSMAREVYCDPLAASIALHALVDNAIKYAKKYSTVYISGRPETEHFAIYVGNEGFLFRSRRGSKFLRNIFAGLTRTIKRLKVPASGCGFHQRSCAIIIAAESPLFTLKAPSFLNLR